MSELTKGLPQAIANGTLGQRGFVQVIGADKDGNKQLIDISDGVVFLRVALSSQFDNWVETKIIPDTVISINNYICGPIQSYASACLTDIEVACKECDNLNENATVRQIKQEYVKPGSKPNLQNVFPVHSRGNKHIKPKVKRMEAVSNPKYTPISSLSPYMNVNWTIKGRVTDKENMRTWKNSGGEGKVFSFVVMDKANSEIKFTCFKDEADKFFNLIKEDKVYEISKGRIKQETYARSRVKNNYTVICSRETNIVLARDDSVPQRSFNFVSIDNIGQITEGEYIDVVGVVTDINEIFEIQTRKGDMVKKREIELKDQSNCSIRVTLWSQNAIENSPETLPIGTPLVLPGARVSDFGGKSLSSNKIWKNYKCPATVALVQWWNAGGAHADANALTRIGGNSWPSMTYTWEQAVSSGVGTTLDPTADKNGPPKWKNDYFVLKATITHIPHTSDRPPWYKGEPKEDSRYKVVERGDGKYVCERTNQEYDSYMPKWCLRFCLSDPTEGHFVSSFNEVTREMLGAQAVEIEHLLNTRGEEAFSEFFRSQLWQELNFKVAAKMDTFQDAQRVKYSVQQIRPVDYAVESENLLSLLYQS